MKIYKLLTVLLLSIALQAFGDTNSQTFIKGNIDIRYNSRANETPAKGVTDVYKLSVNVCNSAQFHGTITDTPLIMSGYFSKSVDQARALNYNIDCDVINPKNPSQTKNVGRMTGRVPIEESGNYRYDTGGLEVNVLPIGNAGGFTSKFGGNALGKPLVRPSNWLDNLKRDAVNITRSVNGKTMTVVLKKYDKMEFRQHILAAGPVQIYQPVTVNGEMLYDYDKSCWFFNNITVQYAVNNEVKIDRLTGTIRWQESPQRKQNGQGEYQFDVRVNEPPPSESAAFASATDESAFFENDSKIPALVGVMKYKDALRGDTTLASNVSIDLTGNNLNKQQVMVLCKLLIFSSVVPMNSD